MEAGSAAARIGIIGSGTVGRALARGFASRGHEVRIGTRDPSKPELREWLEGEGAGVRVATFDETAAFGEVVMLATLWSGTEHALSLAGPSNLDGKVLVDVTNPLAFGEGGPKLAVTGEDSAGERVARWAPGARVVKAFNIVGSPYMVDPDLPGGPPDMFIAGDDDAAKAAVTSICESFGWPVTDIGGIEGARLLEALAMLWITVGARSGSWTHAFKLLRA